MSAPYPYTGRDFFAEPENYEYAVCEDVSFFEGWKRHRAEIIEKLEAIPSTAVEKNSAGKRADMENCELDAISLIQIISDVEQNVVTSGLNHGSAKEVLDSFVAKFEVFRRLFSAYDTALRKVSTAAPASVRDYQAFGFALAQFAKQGSGPKYLSTLLKLNDALATRDYQTWSVDEQLQFARLLRLEADCVADWEVKCCA